MAVSFPLATKNARAQAVVDDVDLGSANATGQVFLRDSGANLLAKLVMTNPAFGAVSNGTAIAASITDGTGLLAGAAVTFDVVDRDETIIFSGTIGAVGSGADLESGSSSVTIAIGDTVSISSLTYIEVS